jgi:hypothetical protein
MLDKCGPPVFAVVPPRDTLRFCINRITPGGDYGEPEEYEYVLLPGGCSDCPGTGFAGPKEDWSADQLRHRLSYAEDQFTLNGSIWRFVGFDPARKERGRFRSFQEPDKGTQLFGGSLGKILPGPSAWADRTCKAQSCGRLCDPLLASIGSPAADTAPDRREFRFGVRFVDPGCPIPGHGQGPLGQECSQSRSFLLSMPTASPTPLPRVLNQVRSARIPLHITQQRVKMVVAFDGKTLEACLVEVACSGGVMVRVPTHRVRMRQLRARTVRAAQSAHSDRLSLMFSRKIPSESLIA